MSERHHESAVGRMASVVSLLVSKPYTIRELTERLGIRTAQQITVTRYLEALYDLGLVRVCGHVPAPKGGGWRALYEWQPVPFAAPDVPLPAGHELSSSIRRRAAALR